MEITMYDTLLQLPLFQGLGKTDITNIISKVKLHFRKYESGSCIVEQGQTCDQLIFLLNGTVVAQTTDARQLYQFQETLEAPCVIEAHSLFGMHPAYTATYRASQDTNIVTIGKSYILSELFQYEIFSLNYLNLLSNRAQIGHHKTWNLHMGNIQEKILTFLTQRSQRQEGEKVLRIKMEVLANLIDETRINVSRTLNEMQEKGLMRLSRKEITIPALERLIEAYA